MASNSKFGDWESGYYVPVGVPTVAVDRIAADDHQLEMASDDEIALAVRNGLEDRYHRIANIYTADGWPSRYVYYSESEEMPEEAAHFPVVVSDMYSQPILKEGIEVLWLKLNATAQDKLYLLLRSGISISERIWFDNLSRTWTIRTSPIAKDEVQYVLKYYVSHLPDNSRNLMDYIRRGRTKAEMQKLFADEATTTLISLDGVWVAALIQGFHNGDGRAAVYQLLTSVAALLRGLTLNLTPVHVFHVTSALSKDGFSVSSSSLSTSDRVCTCPDAKRRKTDEEKPLKKGMPQKKNSRCIGPDIFHHQYVDLFVVTRDGFTGIGKYLILVEIHSSGKTPEQASKKLLQELIFVLQAQNQVFGLLFSKTYVLLYNARKSEDGTIAISKALYPLTMGLEPMQEFCVPTFQKLVLDIFSCMIHAIKYVDA